MNAHDLILAVRELIVRGWTQGIAARDSAGNAVGGRDNSACAWSLMAAMHRVFAFPSGPSDRTAYRLICEAIGTGVAVSAWHEAVGRTKEDVIAVLDRAANEAVPIRISA